MLKNKIVSLFLAVSTLVASFSLTSFAEESKPNLKEQLLQIPAYSKSSMTEGENLVPDRPSIEDQNNFAELSKEIAGMDDKELKKLVSKNLKSIIDKKEKGDGSIEWNKNFVDKIVKDNFQDLYTIINKQESKDKLTPSSGKDILTPPSDVVSAAATSYTPGRKVLTFSKYYYHWTGYTMWGFFCRMDWSWDSTKITSVYPNTYGEIYDPSWGYAGIIANNQRFTNGEIEFNKYVKGDFYWPMQQMVSSHVYPWLNIYVYPNGGYYWTSGT